MSTSAEGRDRRAATSDRAEMAAARVKSARLRAEQLRERIDRLSAGVPPTRVDVAVAQACAEDQRHEALLAQERLAATFAVASELDRRRAEMRSLVERVGGAAGAPPTAGARDPGAAGTGSAGRAPLHPDRDADHGRRDAPDRSAQQVAREGRLLRSALVAVVAPGGGGSDGARPAERRRKLWQTMVDQCGAEGWQGWVHALCVATVSLVPGLRGVAVSGYDRDRIPYLLGVSDDWTRRAEEVHRVVGEGPAVEAYGSEASVVVAHLPDEHARWPGYVAASGGVGPFSVWALPVRLDGVTLGTVSLYWPERAGPTGQDWLDGSVVAAAATTALQADLDAMEDGLDFGDPGDGNVSVATGMVVAQLAVGVEEAFARIRAYAFSNARGLGEVADAIVDGSLRLS